jgi:hypothetical protein
MNLVLAMAVLSTTISGAVVVGVVVTLDSLSVTVVVVGGGNFY